MVEDSPTIGLTFALSPIGMLATGVLVGMCTNNLPEPIPA